MYAAGKGIYEKFKVERTDGQSEPGKKHHGCRYFVLDLDHDDHAGAAIEAYADSCEREYPALAADLRKWIARHDWISRLGEIPPDDSRRPFP